MDKIRSFNRTEKTFQARRYLAHTNGLEIEKNIKELALLNFAIDSKLRSCDLLRMKIRDISSGGVIQSRVLYRQSKTDREVQFEITSRTAQSLATWIAQDNLTPSDFVFPSVRNQNKAMSYSCYLKVIRRWATQLGYVPTFTERIQCAEQRQLSSTQKLKTYVLYSCYLAM